MAQLTAEAAKHIERIPLELKDEFPDVPLDAIERQVAEDADHLMAGAHFADFVPLLVRRAARERLLAQATH